MSTQLPRTHSPFDTPAKPTEAQKEGDAHTPHEVNATIPMCVMTTKSPLVADTYEPSLNAVIDRTDADADDDVYFDDCCCYPSGGQDCHCLCNKGCPLSGHVVGRCVLLFLDFVNMILGVVGGFMSVFSGYCDGSCDPPLEQRNLSTTSMILCFLVFVCYIVAFCFSCVFLASLSWLEGARRDAAQNPCRSSRRLMALYDRKDRNLNIILFSLNVTGCVCSILAMAFGVKYQNVNGLDVGDVAVIIACMALSCVLVILQPIKQVVGQTLCVKP